MVETGSDGCRWKMEDLVTGLACVDDTMRMSFVARFVMDAGIDSLTLNFLMRRSDMDDEQQHDDG